MCLWSRKQVQVIILHDLFKPGLRSGFGFFSASRFGTGMFDNHQRFLLPSSSTPIEAMASSSLWHFRMTLNSVMMSSSEIQRKFQEASLWRKCFQRQQCNILPKTANNTTRILKMGRASSGVELLYHHCQNAASARRKHGGGTKTTILQPCLFFFCNYKSYFSPRTADKENEEAMIYRRTVYDHDDWMRHRSSARHAKHLLSVASSRVILALGPPVMTLTAIAAAITGYNEAVLAHALPLWMPLMQVSSLPFSLTAPALALLLVFRTNASYGRFDEGRKAWGSIVNRTRDITRQALTWTQSPDDAHKVQCFLRHAVAFCYCLKDHVAREEDLKMELKGLLQKKEVEAAMASRHRPNYVLQIMSETIQNCSLSGMQKASIDMNITQFHDNLGICERIFKTPIPLSYTRLTSRFLIIWHLALPLALWDQCSWLVIPATFLSAAALFCIEEVGVLIEEPFSILPLESICASIQENVQGLIIAHEEAVKLESLHHQVPDQGGE
ncbi:unnamed protein product [Sphagnum jensenii]|uniref:Uncharacterized protein n=2 Tax=Sphagnum jensenii TaxID=128206 RepID=A0ABP0VKP4_9BRYO